MIGIVLIGHGRLASENKRAIEHVCGVQPLMIAIDVVDSDHADELYDTMATALNQCDTDDGVLVFVDLFGGTPCNIALGSIADHACEVISGFSLPCIIKAVTLRNKAQHTSNHSKETLSSLAAQCVDSGHKYMRLLPDDMVSGASDA